MFTSLENGTEPIPYCHVAERKPDDSPVRNTNTYSIVTRFPVTPRRAAERKVQLPHRLFPTVNYISVTHLIPIQAYQWNAKGVTDIFYVRNGVIVC